MAPCVIGAAALSPAAVPKRHPLALLTVIAAQFIFAMDLLIVVVALPRIQHDLGFQPAGLTWVRAALR